VNLINRDFSPEYLCERIPVYREGEVTSFRVSENPVLVIVEIVVLAAAAVLGYTGIVNLVGDRIITAASGGKVNPLVSIAIGVLVFGLLGMIPILGGLLTMVLSVIALGMALVSRFGTYDQVIRESTGQGEQTSGPEMEDGPGMETDKEENARPEMKPDNKEKSRPEDGIDES